MSLKTILQIALVPIWILFLMFAIQFIFGLLTAPSSVSVAIGILLLSVLIIVSLYLFKKIYLENDKV